MVHTLILAAILTVGISTADIPTGKYQDRTFGTPVVDAIATQTAKGLSCTETSKVSDPVKVHTCSGGAFLDRQATMTFLSIDSKLEGGSTFIRLAPTEITLLVGFPKHVLTKIIAKYGDPLVTSDNPTDATWELQSDKTAITMNVSPGTLTITYLSKTARDHFKEMMDDLDEEKKLDK